jgi:hypothetical protein
MSTRVTVANPEIKLINANLINLNTKFNLIITQLNSALASLRAKPIILTPDIVELGTEAGTCPTCLRPLP